MLACYGVTEQQIRDGWTVAQFDRYRDFAKDVWLLKGRVS
jgi:hypothetical protein